LDVRFTIGDASPLSESVCRTYTVIMMTPHRIGPAPASVTAVSLPWATRLIRAVAAVCLLLALLCNAALAQQVEIELNNGTVVQGELVAESEQAVTLLRSGIREPYLRSDIKEIRTQRELTVDEQFDQRRAAIADTDLLERYKLAAWGVNAKAYRKALAEIQAIRLAADGDTPPSLLTALDKLETVVNNRLQLEEPEATPDDPTAGTDDTQTPEQRPERKELTWLTDEQVNLIRVYEVDLKDNPRVLVPNEVYNELLENYRTDSAMEPFLQSDGRRRLRTLSDSRFLRLLFDLRAREMYGKVTIRTDPPALQDFRRIMYPNFVSSYFRRQYASGDEPVLPLLFKRGNETNEVYTNFYILAQASHNGMPMIDRDRPEESLLLQWALPRDQALYPAPQIPGWRPFFNGTDDRLFRQYVSVIDKLYQPKPDYGIDYAVPDVRLPQPARAGQAGPPDQPAAPADDATTPEQ